MNPSILNVLLKFRKYQYAFSSDTQGVFLTIGIDEKDRDYLRYFWFQNENDSKSYKILRMTRMPFGVTSSPVIFAATIKFHIRKYSQDQEYHETSEMLNSALYVDNLFYGANTVDKVLNLSQSAVEILKDANINLRKFKTNSNYLKSLWLERDISVARESNEHPIKVLEIIWNTVEDTFKLDVQPLF
ncbi:reverse transcriptase domain-containing protein [Nephila pilipes]|uniref:Reverse transcriptase domain-containing protein n=1 Tax=Nephila pilipes TaxID=299642 RepID=A0A8X6NMY0_NEPPI|nr:reverse transcriptase domain-containing protein [Nephila pilipes]